MPIYYHNTYEMALEHSQYMGIFPNTLACNWGKLSGLLRLAGRSKTLFDLW